MSEDAYVVDTFDVEMAVERVPEHYGVEIREDYSGRWMYGDTCFGVVGRPAGLARFLVVLATEKPALAIELCDRLRIDDMGTRTIWYFPGTRLGITEPA